MFVHPDNGPVTGANESSRERVADPVPAEPLPPAGGGPDQGTPEPARAEPEPDYKDRWLRAEAELQNYRKRVQRDLEQRRRDAEESVILEMLSVLDDLERALEAATTGGVAEGWTQGVALTAQRMRDVLTRFGVEAVDPTGRAFDPALHEAVLESPAPEGVTPGTVLQVAHKGYRRGERALRPARVVVARADEKR
ncbi:MAG: nucleotide exchange factor GrpE [Candidatus Eisenbacteria bacterium]